MPSIRDAARRLRCSRPRSLLLALLLPASMATFAEGTRTLHPGTYDPAGSRGVMDASNTTNFAGVAAGNQFLYVYAQAGEHILLGSRNRSNGGDVFVYAPQPFGPKGSETIPVTADFSCSSQAGLGTIASRAQELAGPNSADGTATVTDGFAPCWYEAPATGIYGVRFTGATSGGQANTASVATPPILAGNLTSAWDVTVRSSGSSLTDLNGRVFTYAWTIYNNANSRRLYNDLFYVSLDGYRYRQTFRGLDPNRAAFYANAAGFIDTNGAALYHDYRGANAAATGGPSGTAGVTAQRPQYPIFFSDVSPAGANAAEVNRVLAALAIPATPSAPELTSPTFVGNLGGNSSTYSTGGTFTFDTVNTLTYEIVVSRDGVDFDPANPLNRVLTGTALTGSHSVLWDGRDNGGNAFPAGNYEFRIVGRNGEIHFPMVDVEANVNGGPTLTKLNGSQDTTVYFDDRGYRAANGSLIGVLNGHLCGAGSAILQPVPTHSLLGVDSADANLNGSGNYYRSWGGSNDSNADCSNSANEYFGTAKGLDLWALEKSDEFIEPIVIVPPTVGVDVSTQANVTSSVISGDTAYGSFVFNNAGDTTATGVTYTATLGDPAQPVTCPAAVTFTMAPAGVTPTYNPAPACTITFAGMPTSLTPGQSLSFNFNYVVAPTNPGPIPLTTVIAAANETVGAPAPNTATAQTLVARPIVSVVKSANPAPGSQVDIGDTITYTLTVTVANAPLTETLTLADALGTGLTFGSVTNAGSFSCSGSLSCTLPAGTATGSYALTYTATVDGAAVGSVANNVTPSGGGGENPPACGPCSVTHNLPPPVISVTKMANPASGTAVTPGQTITYTLTATVSNGALTAPLVLTDTISANQTFGTVTSAGAYTCTGSVQCTLPSGTTPGTYAVSYTTTVNANAAGSVNNNVVATGGGGTNPPDCTSCSTTHPLQADVSVAKALSSESGNLPGVAEPGETLVYTITLNNSGGSNATSVGVSDPLDPNVVFVSATNGGTLSGGTVSWVGLTVPAGGSLTLAVTVTVADPLPAGVTRIVNLAHETGTTPPNCASTPQPAGCVSIPTAPNIAVTKALSGESGAQTGVAEPGETLTYTITLSNSGGTAATSAGVTDRVDPNTSFVSADNGGAYAAGLVTWTTLTVPAGGTLELTVNVQVASPIPAGVSQVANLAYLTGTPPPACPPAGPQCVLTPTEPSPQLQVTKTVDTTTIPAGGTATYTVSVTNVGTIAVNNVVIDDALPAGITQFIWTCSGTGGAVCLVSSGTGALHQTAPLLPVGATLVYTIQAQVAVYASGNLLNTVVVSPSSNTVCMPSGLPGPCDANATLTVLGSTPVPAPTLGGFAMLLMMLALTAIAWQQYQRRGG